MFFYKGKELESLLELKNGDEVFVKSLNSDTLGKPSNFTKWLSPKE